MTFVGSVRVTMARYEQDLGYGGEGIRSSTYWLAAPNRVWAAKSPKQICQPALIEKTKVSYEVMVDTSKRMDACASVDLHSVQREKKTEQFPC